MKSRVDIVHVKDFGAVGNGTTDDIVAIQAAIDYALTNVSIEQDSLIAKPATVYFDSGHYIVSDEIVIEESRNLRLIGTGSNPIVGGGSLITLRSATATTLLNIKSFVHLRADNIIFRVDATLSPSVLNVMTCGANNSPSFSSQYFLFTNCSFTSTQGVLPTALVSLINTISIQFKNCWFTNADISIQLGDDRNNHLSTLAKGASTLTSIEDCFIQGDIQQNRSYNTTLKNVFFSSIVGTTAPSVILPIGDAEDRSINLINVAWVDGNNTRTGYTQGIAGYCLNVIGGRSISTDTAFNIGGHGRVNIKGFNFDVINKGVVIEATASDVTIDGIQDLSLKAADKTVIEDNRTDIYPTQIYKIVSSDQVSNNLNNTWEVIPQLTTSDRLTGGLNEVSYAVTITNSATVDTQVRVSLYQNSARVLGTTVVADMINGETKTLTLVRKLILANEDAVATIEMQIMKTSALGQLDIKGDHIDNGSSFFQITKL